MNDTLLKRAALADGLVSLAVAGLLIVDAPLLAKPLGLTQSFLTIVGWVIVPFALAWFFVAATRSRPLARFGVIGNLLWAIASAAAIPILQPTALGIAFIAIQAATVLALAYFQNRGLERIASNA
jgi:hypothetical protein